VLVIGASLIFDGVYRRQLQPPLVVRRGEPAVSASSVASQWRRSSVDRLLAVVDEDKLHELATTNK